jgi:hypothetical protein
VVEKEEEVQPEVEEEQFGPQPASPEVIEARQAVERQLGPLVDEQPSEVDAEMSAIWRAWGSHTADLRAEWADVESQTTRAKEAVSRQQRERLLHGLQIMLVRECKGRRTIDHHEREEWGESLETFQRRHDFLYEKKTTQTLKEMRFQQRFDEMKAQEAAQWVDREDQEFLGYLLASGKIYELANPEAVIQALTAYEEPPSRLLIEPTRHSEVKGSQEAPQPSETAEPPETKMREPEDEGEEGSEDARGSITEEGSPAEAAGKDAEVLSERPKDVPSEETDAHDEDEEEEEEDDEEVPSDVSTGRPEKRHREEDDIEDEPLWKDPKHESPEATSPSKHPTMRLFPSPVGEGGGYHVLVNWNDQNG